MQIKLLRDGDFVPTRGSMEAAGLDLKAAVACILQPGERKFVPCGFSMSLPVGMEAQARARSGLALKKGIGLANGVGTIDSDYRGEVGAILINLSHESFTIEVGDRIAQLVIAPVWMGVPEVVKELDATSRGSDGFGSTGK